MRYAATLAVLALVLGGCSSSEDEPERTPTPDGPAIVLPRENEPRLEISFSRQWSDIDRNEKGELDPEQVAEWVVERRNAVQRCMRNVPQAVGQAMEILDEIVSRVSDSSRDRYLLAQCVFAEAAYWWRLADGYAWEMNRLELDRTARDDEGGHKLTDDEVKAKIAELRGVFDLLLVNVNKSAQRALNLFTVYRQQRPDDKSVYDFMWKLHFYLQNFVEAQRWLDLVLTELDLAGVPEHDPLRQDYRALRLEIVDRITEQRLGNFQPVKPTVRDRMRVGAASTQR
jgi:hypothetical protein